jgi:glycosyltransferase involved in cell wall biosynthesis
MLITLIDDSIPFNGASPSREALGGAEKAFASLTSAIARRGHVVRAITRTSVAAAIDGVSWLPWEGRRPSITEILIAFRKPTLLDVMPATKRKVFWFTRPADFLLQEPAERLISRAEPQLVFAGPAHRATYKGDAPRLARVIPFGVREEYLNCDQMAPSTPPVAVVTTHPLYGTDWLVGLWTDRIALAVPGAELHIYSATFAAADRGGEIAENIRPIYEKVKAAREKGVRVRDPAPDPAMAEVYRTARVHLYPGSESEMLGSTLAESQACGLPAVVRPLGAAPERVIDGETGYAVGEDEGFAQRVIELLGDDAAFDKLSREARLRQRGRGWDKVAGEFEVLYR